MDTRIAVPETLAPGLLAQYEALHARWAQAHERAEAAQADLERRFDEHARGRGRAPDAREVQHVLLLRLAASRLQLQALQVLRDQPI